MMYKSLILPIALVSLASLSSFVACKKQDQAAVTGGYQPGQTGVGGAGGVAGVGGAAGTAPVVTAAPAVTAAPSASAPATNDPTLLAAVQPMLTQLASTQVVAGSKPLGTAVVGNVGGAQTLETQILLQPNKCYSAVAIGSPPIAELNIQFLAVTILPGLAPILATDQDTGPSAVLGKKPNCYKWALPLPASVKVVVQSASGTGIAGLQVFEK